MFAVLVPNNPNLTILAGIVKDGKNSVRISVVSSTSQEVAVNYKTLEDFRENYCDTCNYYYHNRKTFRSKLNPEDFPDQGTYAKELSQELQTWEQDWEAQSCSGGEDIMHDGDCLTFSYEEVIQEKTILHKTLPHIYQYTLSPSGPFIGQFKSYSPQEDKLFAFDTCQINPRINSEDGEMDLRVAAYQVGNVYNDATVCWGYHDVTPNMRRQYNLFWNSVFNGDLIPDGEGLGFWLENFHENKDYLRWEWTLASDFFGDQRISSADQPRDLPIEGVLIVPGKASTSDVHLTWFFKEDNHYFAYLEEGNLNSRVELDSNLLFLD